MPTVTRTVTTPAPLDVVRAYLRDFGNAPEWDAGTITCEPVDPSAPVTVGKQWTNVSEFRGRQTTLTYTLEADEPTRLRIVGRNKTVTSEDEMTFTGADGGGTTVSYTATFTFHGAAKLATPLMLPALKGLADDAERSLGAALQKLPTA
ncbi:SRPBCC family protein [Actinomycetospora endophytica]|uniref:SRPBCC family protein n=1 Tax=Actinomycetospora endophytica TaxID=2291215 RepID=A0ABS8P4Z8_9PSEU|nr:SRPBCC family protein [Actinomycetospora endophytica]MCD2193332.1 SRPBCC family protein [Actinomycetospora endophytica]